MSTGTRPNDPPGVRRQLREAPTNEPSAMEPPTAESGLITTELAIVLAAWLLGCVALVVMAGRVAQAQGEVQSAAQEAARAATLTADPGTAASRGDQIARANLAAARLACAGGADVDVQAGAMAPGEYVTVTVTCTASFGDVAGLGIPGSRQFSAQATEIVDAYRSDP